MLDSKECNANLFHIDEQRVYRQHLPRLRSHLPHSVAVSSRGSTEAEQFVARQHTVAILVSVSALFYGAFGDTELALSFTACPLK